MNIKKVIRLVKDPVWAISVFVVRHPSMIKDDEKFLKWDFYHGLGKWPNIAHPQLSEQNGRMSFNEKLNWMKIHVYNPLMTKLVDKYAVKEWVQQHCSDVKIIPTLGIWEHFSDIDFGKLPNQFVLKCTHDSGGLVICKDKSKLDKAKARVKIEKSLRSKFWLRHREYPYKEVPPRIIAEQYMVDESGLQLKDYKFFCFNGDPKMFYVATDRPSNTCYDFFDMDFKHLPFKNNHPWQKKPIKSLIILKK